jgi:hypothetical protein
MVEGFDETVEYLHNTNLDQIAQETYYKDFCVCEGYEKDLVELEFIAEYETMEMAETVQQVRDQFEEKIVLI